MEAIEQHVVPSCCVVYFALQGGLTFEFVWRAVWSATIQMKSSEQYVVVVLWILLHLQSAFHDHLSLWMKSLSVTRQTKVIERYCNCLPYAVQGCSKFWVCGWNSNVWPSKWKLWSTELAFLWHYLYSRHEKSPLPRIKCVVKGFVKATFARIWWLLTRIKDHLWKCLCHPDQRR